MEQPHEHPTEESQKILQIGIALSLIIFFLEFLGGLATHSLALLSDAWHIFIDIWSLIVSFLAIFLARRPVTDRRTFGLHRMEVMAALINGCTVFLIAMGILYAAYRRLRHPQIVHASGLLAVATIGLILNLIAALVFYQHAHRDLNLRGAFSHMIGDALNTLAVLIAGLLMLWTHRPYIDAGVSVMIAGIVLWGSGRLLYEALNTLLEGVPHGIQINTVENQIKSIKGIESVHDLHVWSICSHLNALSGHILLLPEEMGNQHAILETIGNLLKNHFGIIHTTIQVESKAWPALDNDHSSQGGCHEDKKEKSVA